MEWPGFAQLPVGACDVEAWPNPATSSSGKPWRLIERGEAYGWVADSMLGEPEVSGSSGASDQSDGIYNDDTEGLMELYLEVNAECRGGSGQSALDACAEREQIGARLEEYGWCWGATAEFSAEATWERC